MSSNKLSTAMGQLLLLMAVIIGLLGFIELLTGSSALEVTETYSIAIFSILLSIRFKMD